MNDLEKGRIIIINLFSFLALLVLASLIPVMNTISTIDLIAIFVFQVILVCFPILNAFGKYRLSLLLFHIIIPIISAGLIVIYGPINSDEANFILCMALGFIGYKEKIRQAVIIAWNFFCFTAAIFCNLVFGVVYQYENTFFEDFFIALYSILMVIFIARFIINNNYKFSRKIRKEQLRAEELLHNILPVEVADELKENGKAQAAFFENVSVLFTDFEDFTQKAKNLEPRILVDTINEIFSAFDRITEKYKIEKIKTIGDAYLAVCGVPKANKDHAKNVVLAGMEMLAFLERHKEKQKNLGLPYFEMRIGIHTGPIVAGIVGIKKYQYDVWGKTVSTANSVEKNGIAGKICISTTTHELIKNDFDFTPHISLEVEDGKQLNSYIVESVDIFQKVDRN